MVYLALEVLFTAIEAIIMLMSFCIISQQKRFFISKMFKSILFVMIYTVFTYWVSSFMPIGMHTVVIFAFIVLTLSYLTKTNLVASCSIMLIVYLTMFVLEFTVMVMSMSISKLNMAQILDNQRIMLICTIIVKAIELVALIVLYNIKLYGIFSKRISESKMNLPSFFLLQVFILGIIVISTNYLVAKPYNLVFYNVLLLLLYVLFLVIAAIDFKERTQISALAYKSVLQEEHIKNIEAIINIIRKEKHDFANHLNTIYGLCTLNKPDLAERIKAYINKAPIKPYYTNKSVDSGIDYIDALLAVKNNDAIDYGISIKLDIRDKLDYADIEDKDLVIVWANIIDNAFDAILSEGNTENKYISITTFIIENSYYISIKNNGPEIPERNLKKIFTNGFSTKGSNKPDHGYGLYIVEQTIKKSGGSISVISNEQETEFLIKLRLKRGEHDVSVSKAYKYDPSGEF